MKTLIIAVFLGLFSLPALASEISCGGTEPFWNLRVDDQFMRYSDPVLERTESLSIISKQEAHGYSAGYMTVIKSRYTTLTLVQGECNDGMSDEIYTHHAVYDKNGTILGGCCNVPGTLQSEETAIGR